MAIRLSPLGVAFSAVAAAAIISGGFYVFGSTSFEDENGQPTEPWFGKKDQETGSITREIGNIEYTLRDGLVIEDYPDKNHMNFDFYIYDLNNQIVMADMIGDASQLKTFSEMRDNNGNLPVHLGYVQGIACDIAQEYALRADSPEYGDVPADVQLFSERHCDLEM